MSAYYNEIDPAAVAVLRRLISDDVIAPGDVDTRSIKEVRPDDLRGYAQCHFFAGGGLWSVAARMAGWPDGRPLWTASCPCQGESGAGLRLGERDPRHLWPDLFPLIRARRPAVLMGEQVARASGTHWLDRVCTDLEDEAYAIRAVDIPTCAVDAPHQRNRLYWIAVADADRDGLARRSQRDQRTIESRQQAPLRHNADRCDPLRDGRPTGRTGDLAHSQGFGWREGRAEYELRSGRPAAPRTNGPSSLGDASSAGLSASEREAILGARRRSEGRATEQSDGALPYRNGSWWADAEWIACHDGKARRAQPGTPLLVDGVPGRVGLWRIAGNAISPILAAEVIAAFLDVERPADPRRPREPAPVPLFAGE